MRENRIIKYHFNNKVISENAAGHIFGYLSAFSDYKFVEDKNAPVVWRDDRGEIPASARIILGREIDIKGFSDIKSDSGNGRAFIAPDPIERIFAKISISATLGPYSDGRHQPENDPEESLGSIILNFFDQLRIAGVIEPSGHNATLWPGGHKFAMALTHDVDIIRRSVRGSVRLLFNRDVPGGFKGLYDSIGSVPGRARNPYDNIRQWIEHENKFGIKSTFFIFPGNRKNKNDPKYGLKKLEDSLEYIMNNGFGLALHTGIECRRGESIEESRKLINRAGDFTVGGIRPHYLSASLPEYWRKAAELGFEYSSCLGFDEEIGFYRGIDLPLMPFDADNDTPLGIVEIPIAIMDCGLINDNYKNMEESLDSGKKLIDRVRRAGGILVLDWHQRTMYNPDYPGWAEACFDLIDYARKQGAFLTTMEDTAGLLKGRMAIRQ
jgi:peptidoglycan/xylan/chitin deacetylase (PgdA/CDA1 family)